VRRALYKRRTYKSSLAPLCFDALSIVESFLLPGAGDLGRDSCVGSYRYLDWHYEDVAGNRRVCHRHGAKRFGPGPNGWWFAAECPCCRRYRHTGGNYQHSIWIPIIVAALVLRFQGSCVSRVEVCQRVMELLGSFSGFPLRSFRAGVPAPRMRGLVMDVVRRAYPMLSEQRAILEAELCRDRSEVELRCRGRWRELTRDESSGWDRIMLLARLEVDGFASRARIAWFRKRCADNRAPGSRRLVVVDACA
jgi:hypothetical protein